MKVLVTGCAGFIGSNVARLLLELGHTVTGVDINNPSSSMLTRWRLDGLIENPQFDFHQVDILDKDGLGSALRSHTNGAPVDTVINLAAKTGVRDSAIDPRSYYETNVLGTLNLLELCRQFDFRRLILASTSSVYGELPVGPVSEEAQCGRPLSPYGASKCAAESLLHSYHHLHGIHAVVLRYFTVYGPAGRPDMSVFRFIRAINEGQPVTLYGDGTQRRDFTYVDDIARGTAAALNLGGYETINLGRDKPVMLKDLIGKIENAVGRPASYSTTGSAQSGSCGNLGRQQSRTLIC